jgi:hypothetical protein
MGRYALIEGGVVKNVIAADAQFVAGLPGEWVEDSEKTAAPGKHFSGGAFSRPAKPDNGLWVDFAASETEFDIGTVVSVPFSTNFNDGKVMVTYRAEGDPRRYLKRVTVSVGEGVFEIVPETSGVYYVDVSDLKSDTLKVNGESVQRFEIAVG